MATTTVSITELPTSNVYLFKNGYGMIVTTFDFPSNRDNTGNHLKLTNLPSNPVHGTFWIQSSSNNTSIKSIRVEKIDESVEKQCLTVEDLLVANVEKNVDLRFTDDITADEGWISGTIISVKRAQEQLSKDEGTNVIDTEPTNAATNAVYGFPVVTTRPPSIQTGNLTLFQTDNRLLAFPTSSVRAIRGETLERTYRTEIFKNCLSIEYQNDTRHGVEGVMKYLTYGITWAPSYNLVLSSSKDPSVKKLRLSAKAVILNDIEDIQADHLFCIVGFPNISKFASVIDPIISGKNVKEFLDHLKQCEVQSVRSRPNNNQTTISNTIMTQQMVMPMSATDNSGPNDTRQDASNADGLHLYDFKNILLKKKERLMLPIFDIEIAYKDVYHCKIDALQAGSIYTRYDEKKQFEEVWHSVEFENTSNFVWTTAPILITKGQQEQQFIGQDALTYTLKGSTTFVNLTKALDVRVQLDEKVTNTNPTRTTVISNNNYQTDQIEGKIVVMNYKSEEVVVVINVSLMGKISNYSIAPKKDAVKADENVANQQHDIQWNVNVKPKQTIEIKYIRSYNKRI